MTPTEAVEQLSGVVARFEVLLQTSEELLARIGVSADRLRAVESEVTPELLEEARLVCARVEPMRLLERYVVELTEAAQAVVSALQGESQS